MCRHVGARHETRRALSGALGLGALASLIALAPEESAAKKTNAKRKKCQKRCKKGGKSCAQACNELPEHDRDRCKADCKNVKSQCKKLC